ncbi:hypothetical protein IL306_012689 [Fusarium sp. DS 682]|nr:hypothetical protein IL306_012689 [Fusarium sp. DS 682]
MKEAAFQAYLALYKEGLITDNLLPINAMEENKEEKIDLTSEPLFNPWIQIAKRWKTDCDKSIYHYEFTDEFTRPIRFEVELTVTITLPRQITLYPVAGLKWSIKCTKVTQRTHDQSLNHSDHTSALLAMNFAHRWPVEDREHVVKIAIIGLGDVTRNDIGTFPFRGFEEAAVSQRFLVRDQFKTPFHYVRTIPSQPRKEDVQRPFYQWEKAPPNEEYLVVERWARRGDLLHDVRDGQAKKSRSKLYEAVLPISYASVDRIKRRAVKCGTFIPHLIHELEVHLIASELSSTLLKPVGIKDLQLVLEAISSGSASEPVNYERLEFLGDSILKFCTVIQAYSEHPFWPEGLLNHFKDRIVSNERLQRVCLEKGLSKFILSKIFTALKWRPLYLDTYLDEKSIPQPVERTLGSKNLADVVEALIGAAYQDGGMTKALKCISVFLGDKCNWHEEGVPRDILFAAAPSDVPLPPTMEYLEELVDYQFNKKSLLIEAVTHGSYAADMQERSYEQLEFLGDAILDYIIVTQMFKHDPPLPHGRLHMIKTAMVNGEFLAFVNMVKFVGREDEVIKPDGTIETTMTQLPLWKFMRSSSSEMAKVMAQTEEKFAPMREEIRTAFEKDKHYPWVLLARLEPKKFYSDMFEALLGAVWVDSGSIEACTHVLRNFGIMSYLDRILKEDVHVQHPKEELTKFAGNQRVNYSCNRLDGPEPRYSCTVTTGDRLVGEVEDALNENEAEAKAAENAVRLLTEEMNELDQDGYSMDGS